MSREAPEGDSSRQQGRVTIIARWRMPTSRDSCDYDASGPACGRDGAISCGNYPSHCRMRLFTASLRSIWMLCPALFSRWKSLSLPAAPASAPAPAAPWDRSWTKPINVREDVLFAAASHRDGDPSLLRVDSGISRIVPAPQRAYRPLAPRLPRPVRERWWLLAAAKRIRLRSASEWTSRKPADRPSSRLRHDRLRMPATLSWRSAI